MPRSILMLCLCACAGCASKLEAKGAEGDAGVALVMSGNFGSRALDDSVTETVVDATVTGAWQRFDFDTGKSADDDDSGWDLEFNRFLIRSNGGVSGEGGVEVARVEGEAFGDVTAAPGDGFAMDREDGPEDANTDPDNLFNSGDANWYDYNVMTHELKPHDATYFIHSTEGSYFKLHFESYYDKAGTPANLRFHWAPIDAP